MRRTLLFGKFPYGALRTLLLASRLISLKTSRPLFTENDMAQSGFLLADGLLRYDLGGASEQPTYLTPPAVIGEMALVTESSAPRDGDRGDELGAARNPARHFLARHRRVPGKRGAHAPAVLRPFAQAG